MRCQTCHPGERPQKMERAQSRLQRETPDCELAACLVVDKPRDSRNPRNISGGCLFPGKPATVGNRNGSCRQLNPQFFPPCPIAGQLRANPSDHRRQFA